MVHKSASPPGDRPASLDLTDLEQELDDSFLLLQESTRSAATAPAGARGTHPSLSTALVASSTRTSVAYPRPSSTTSGRGVSGGFSGLPVARVMETEGTRLCFAYVGKGGTKFCLGNIDRSGLHCGMPSHRRDKFIPALGAYYPPTNMTKGRSAMTTTNITLLLD